MNDSKRQVLLLVLLGVVLYANTLDVPFYFDDLTSIVNNPGITDFGAALRNLFSSRGLSFLSFAANYQIGGLEVLSYHLVNLVVHLAVGLLVFVLLRRFFPAGQRWLPLFGAAIFIAHPVQTQAVTYIVQRMASLAALFTLLAMYCYMRARGFVSLGTESREQWKFWYPAAVISVLFAVLSKENAVISPFLLLLTAWFFSPGRFDWKQELAFLVPFLAGGLLTAGYLLVTTSVLEGSLTSIELFVSGESGRTELSSAIPDVRLRYFATQLVVFWTYLQLLVVPWGQALDYSYPLADTVLSLSSALGLLGLLGLVFLVCKSGNRYLLFALLWFVIALAVESSFLPLDPIFDHRLYLPMFGVVVGLCELFRKIRHERLAQLLAIALVLTLGGLSLARNNLWRNPVALWEDNLHKAPHSYRVKLSLAEAYLKAGREADSMRLVAEVLRQSPSPTMIGNLAYRDNMLELGKAYMRHGRVEEATQLFSRASLYYPEEAIVYLYLGEAYAASGDLPAAIRNIARAYALAPDNATIEQHYRKYLPFGAR